MPIRTVELAIPVRIDGLGGTVDFGSESVIFGSKCLELELNCIFHDFSSVPESKLGNREIGGSWFILSICL